MIPKVDKTRFRALMTLLMASDLHEHFDPFEGAWFVYMLRCADGTLYTGVTNNLPHRIAVHNAGKGSKYVRGRLPASLAWSRMIGDKREAMREEARIKRLPRHKKESMLRWQEPTKKLREANEMLRLHLKAVPPSPEGMDEGGSSIMRLPLSSPVVLSVRDRLVRKYSWSTPTEEALREILSHGPVVEMGAGGGYWAWLMRVLGGDVVAYDLHADGSLNLWKTDGKVWTDVLQGDPSVLTDHRDRTLFLCWPPMDSEMASKCLGTWAGDIVAFIGNTEYTGDQDFHTTLSRDFSLVKTVELPQWPGIRDRLEVWERIC